MELSLLHIMALLAGGLMAGLINSVAGGGSLIALPILIFAGVPPVVANGTNRVAVVIQCLTGSLAYHRGGKMPVGHAKKIILPLLIGTLLGAGLAANLSNEIFKPLLAVLMLALAGLLLLKPSRWLNPPTTPPLKGMTSFITLVGVGIHLGFIQAGVGFSILATLVLGHGLDLVEANAIKLLVVLGLASCALGVFAFHGQVDWVAGLILAVGNGTGGYLGARMALKKGAPWIRWFLIITVVISAVALLGL